MDIEVKVLLLAILKKEENETLNEVVLKLEEAQVFSLKDGKRFLKDLKNEEYISDTVLSVKGILVAQEIEKEFKI